MKKFIALSMLVFALASFAQLPWMVQSDVEYSDGTYPASLYIEYTITSQIVPTMTVTVNSNDNIQVFDPSSYYNPATGHTAGNLNGQTAVSAFGPETLEGLYRDASDNEIVIGPITINRTVGTGIELGTFIIEAGTAIEGMVVEAVAMDQAAKIIWRAVETNNAGFIVNGEFVETRVGTSTEVQEYSYVVRNLENGQEYTISVQAQDEAGNRSEAMTVKVVPVAGATGEVPVKYELNQNYPNPFNPTTNIKFSVPEAGLVSLKLFNVMGQEVATLVNDYYHPAVVNYTLDASNLATGVYFYRIDVNNFSDTKKMALVK